MQFLCDISTEMCNSNKHNLLTIKHRKHIKYLNRCVSEQSLVVVEVGCWTGLPAVQAIMKYEMELRRPRTIKKLENQAAHILKFPDVHG